jgi:hypothetical protein
MPRLSSSDAVRVGYGYVLKYCHRNCGSGRVRLQNLLSEDVKATRDHKSEHCAATWIASGSECFAGMCGFWRRPRRPTVATLDVHLPGQRIVLSSNREAALERVDIARALESYLGRPRYLGLDELTYLDSDVPSSVDYRGASSSSNHDQGEHVHWANPRKRSILCMLISVHLGHLERFALRLLLRDFPARSWDDVRTRHGWSSEIFHEATRAVGLLSDRNHEAAICLQDTIVLNSPLVRSVSCSFRWSPREPSKIT